MHLIRNYRHWRVYRETVTELGRLSNRQLHDLGIVRDEIKIIARRAIERNFAGVDLLPDLQRTVSPYPPPEG